MAFFDSCKSGYNAGIINRRYGLASKFLSGLSDHDIERSAKDHQAMSNKNKGSRNRIEMVLIVVGSRNSVSANKAIPIFAGTPGRARRDKASNPMLKCNWKSKCAYLFLAGKVVKSIVLVIISMIGICFGSFLSKKLK